MNSTKSAPVTRGELTPDDAERFAAMFKPIWELDDAPFAQARPNALTGQDVQQLGRAGVHADVQLASNGIAAAAGPHSPPAAYQPPIEDGSIVLDIQPDPTPPPVHHRPPVPQHVQQVVHAQPQMQAPPMQAQRAPQSARRAPPPAVRNNLLVDSGEFAPPKKSNVGLFIGIGLVALLAAGGIAYKVIGSSSKTDDSATKPSLTTAQTHEEARIPPPPPADLTPATTATTTATTAKTADTVKPVDTAPAVTAPPPATTVAVKPPPPATTTTVKPPPTAHTATTKPTGKPGGGIVRDNPF